MGHILEQHLDHEAVPLTNSQETIESPPSQYRTSHRYYHNVCTVISVVLNCCLLVYIVITRPAGRTESVPVTAYAGLPRNVPIAFNSSSPYGLGSSTESRRSLLWEQLDTSAGEISLDNVFAKTQNLPDSTPFFWDNKRSIYLLNAHHSLHCLRKVRRWVVLAQYNQSQLDSYPHLVHCMDHLLQNIICEADDTPMYTSPLRNATTGLGQRRMCRSWDRLTQWAHEQTACFGYINETQGVNAVIERFRYCPPGSAAAERMRAYFGYPSTWFQQRPTDIETIPKYWTSFID